MDSTLTGFYNEFMELVKENAIDNQQSVEQQLTEDIIEYIKEDGFACSPELVYCLNTRCETQTSPEYFKINAFDYSEESGILDVFITNYIESTNVPELKKKQLETCINNQIHFVSQAITNANFSDFLKSQGSDDAAEIADLILSESKSKHISLLRFFIITNCVKKIEYKFSSEIKIGDISYDCEFNVWDIETVRKSDIASRSDGAIDIDFANYYNHSIECLELTETDGVKSYLAIMPAVILAKVFGEYKARLLNQNVRNYLGGKIKVNRGMAETLRQTPGLFFAYNNGISSTANGVTAIRDEETGRCIITNIRNWQIVNGGQTTNTIYRIYKENPETLSSVFVTMKLSEIKIADDKEKGKAISNIARFANSQTQIKESDLSANIDYMVKLQDFSRSEWCPAASERKGTKWFFERMRGQYDLEAGDKKSKHYKEFCKEYPKKGQRFLKTDLAKWEMSWHDEPYTASKGGEQCYDAFYKNFLAKDAIDVTKEYFHDLIAKAIIYEKIAKVNKANGIKAYLNIICNYALSVISIKSKGSFDLEYVWNHQEVHPELIPFIEEISKILKKHIDQLSQQGENPSVKAKNSQFWKDVKLKMANISELPKSVLSIKENELSDTQKKTFEKFLSIELSVWKRLSDWGYSSKKLSLIERKKVDHIITYIEKGQNVSYSNAENALKLLNKSKDLGF